MMVVGLDLIVATATDDVASGNQELDQNCNRIGFAMRCNGRDHIASETVISGFIELRPMFWLGDRGASAGTGTVVPPCALLPGLSATPQRQFLLV
jgi:hypothetical protein